MPLHSGNTRKQALMAILLASAFGAHGPAQAQVKYFDHVPTSDEILSALRAAKPAAPAPVADGTHLKMRGIEWGVGAASALPAAAFSSASPAPALALPVNFDFGTARLSRASVGYIEAVVAVLNQNPDMRLVVEGHTDAAGDAKSNAMLSWERAFSVFHLMIEKYDIDPARLQLAGKGSSEPLPATDPLNSMNRRVQFRAISG